MSYRTFSLECFFRSCFGLCSVEQVCVVSAINGFNFEKEMRSELINNLK